jgi:hypothetical protein
MLRPEDAEGSPFGESGPNGIGADRALRPIAADFEVVTPTLIDDPRIAGCLNDESTRIGQDHHRGGFCEEEVGPLQSGAGCRQEHGILTAAAEHFRFTGEWRLVTVYRHAELARPLPGGCDALRNSLGRLSLQQEGFPGQASFVLLCHAFPSLFPSVAGNPAVPQLNERRLSSRVCGRRSVRW